MPLEEGAGCILLVLKGIFEIVVEVSGHIIGGTLTDFLGHVGVWTERIVTLGFSKPDPESWFSIFLGWVVFVAVIVAVAWWSLKGKG